MNKIGIDNLKIKTAQISLFVGLFIFLIKIVAYFITNSSAIFSDAAESVVHILATGMVLYSIIISSRPPDESHFYGHGNVEYFSAGIEGLLIVTAAITIIYFAVSGIILGSKPNELGIGTSLIAISGIVNLILGYYIITKGKQTNSLALVADGKHILTDSITSLGVVIGLFLVLLTDIYLLDPIIAIIIAINIIFTGYKLIRESISGLMMETDNYLLDLIAQSINSIRKDYHIDIYQLRFWKSADNVFIDFHLTLPYFFNIKQSHKIEKELSEKLSHDIRNSQIRTHFDYCEPILCKYCNFGECEVRKTEFSHYINWDIQKLINEPIRENNEQ